MVLSSKTKQLVFDLSSSNQIVDCAIQGTNIYTLSQGGEISLWDVRMRDVVLSFADDGNYKPTVIKASTNGKHIATGSYSGIVNLYQTNKISEACKPSQQFQNLTTSINLLSFNANSEILAFGSKWKRNAFRLAHT